jgi:hypothetical protein
MLNVISYTKRTGCFEQSVSFKVKVLNYNSSTLKGDIINLFYTLYDKYSTYFIFVYIAIGLCIIKSCIGSKKKSKSIKHLKDKSINNEEDDDSNCDSEEVDDDGSNIYYDNHENVYQDDILEKNHNCINRLNSINFTIIESASKESSKTKFQSIKGNRLSMNKSKKNKSIPLRDTIIDNEIKINENINEISIDFDKLESGKFLNSDNKNSDLISLKQTMKKSNNNKSTLRIDKSIDNNIKLNEVSNFISSLIIFTNTTYPPSYKFLFNNAIYLI